MRIAGIIAEYNPLHNGHLRLFQKVREELSEQTPIVVIMSGAFVRGVYSGGCRARLDAREGQQTR